MGVSKKIGVFSPKPSIFIRFSMKKNIHFGGFSHYFLETSKWYCTWHESEGNALLNNEAPWARHWEDWEAKMGNESVKKRESIGGNLVELVVLFLRHTLQPVLVVHTVWILASINTEWLPCDSFWFLKSLPYLLIYCAKIVWIFTTCIYSNMMIRWKRDDDAADSNGARGLNLGPVSRLNPVWCDSLHEVEIGWKVDDLL